MTVKDKKKLHEYLIHLILAGVITEKQKEQIRTKIYNL